ncbi:MAG: alpha/beta hydrolase [Alicyclobacillaceae bacterium]|nr:alpha/beta hydrolase [Alicyclobacillaceae bacterium]
MPRTETIRVRDNIETKYLVEGSGDPVLFLHGAGGLKWDAYLDRLAQQFRVIAPYHPGTGGSTGERALRGWWDLVLYYDELFDVLGIEDVNLVGHSFGGMVAAEVAATFRRRVKKLILICPAGLWLDEKPMVDLFAVVAYPEELFSKLFYDLKSPAAQFVMSMPEDPEAQKEVMVEQQVVLGEVGRYMWQIPDKGLSRRIHRIDARTLILWGKHDGLIPVEYGQEFQNRIADARLKIFENAAHYPQLESLEEASALSIQFLKD